MDFSLETFSSPTPTPTQHPETDPKRTWNGPKQSRNGAEVDRNQAFWGAGGLSGWGGGGGVVGEKEVTVLVLLELVCTRFATLLPWPLPTLLEKAEEFNWGGATSPSISSSCVICHSMCCIYLTTSWPPEVLALWPAHGPRVTYSPCGRCQVNFSISIENPECRKLTN